MLSFDYQRPASRFISGRYLQPLRACAVTLEKQIRAALLRKYRTELKSSALSEPHIRLSYIHLSPAPPAEANIERGKSPPTFTAQISPQAPPCAVQECVFIFGTSLITSTCSRTSRRDAQKVRCSLDPLSQHTLLVALPFPYMHCLISHLLFDHPPLFFRIFLCLLLINAVVPQFIRSAGRFAQRDGLPAWTHLYLCVPRPNTQAIRAHPLCWGLIWL